MTHHPSRRRLLSAAAWSAPAIVLATSAPAFADSTLKPGIQWGGGATAVQGAGAERLLISQGGFGNGGPDDIPGPMTVTITVAWPDGGEVPAGEPMLTWHSTTLEGRAPYPDSHDLAYVGSGTSRKVVITATYASTLARGVGRQLGVALVVHPAAPAPVGNAVAISVAAPGFRPASAGGTVYG